MEILTKRLGLAFLLAAIGANAFAAATITLIPSGLVDVRSAQNLPWHPVAGQVAISPGDEVRTHRQATAQLVFSDGSRVQINSFSIFAIDKSDAQETSFSLKIGKIRAAFAGLLSSRISIRTPSAVCAVRGTVFEIGVENKNTEVTMAEGVLEVKDGQGRGAVLTSEETMKIGEQGMERPHLLSLRDARALPAVRPYAVHQEMSRASHRTMLEDMRNRELKANESQLGKNTIDAFGRRVRLEEYVLRPSANSFELLFLNQRSGSFNWGHYVESFAAPIPNDLSLIPAIVANSVLSPTQPTNWLKSIEFYATNAVDAERELYTYGNPVLINFAGFGKGYLWYPSSIVDTQTLYGPGVPGGQRIEFQQAVDYNVSNPGLFTWAQAVQVTPGGSNLQQDFYATLNPASQASVLAGGNSQANGYYTSTLTTVLLPNGPNAANQIVSTTYPDQSTLTVQKFLIDDTGNILNSSPTSGVFSQNGSYNEEIKIDSNLFQGRSIDVLIAPSILQQTGTAATTPNNL